MIISKHLIGLGFVDNRFNITPRVANDFDLIVIDSHNQRFVGNTLPAESNNAGREFLPGYEFDIQIDQKVMFPNTAQRVRNLAESYDMAMPSLSFFLIGNALLDDAEDRP